MGFLRNAEKQIFVASPVQVINGLPGKKTFKPVAVTFNGLDFQQFKTYNLNHAYRRELANYFMMVTIRT